MTRAAEEAGGRPIFPPVSVKLRDVKSKVKRNVFTVKLDVSALELKLKTKESKNARMIRTAGYLWRW